MIKIHCVDHNKWQKILKDMETPDYLHASWETYIQVKKQPVRTRWRRTDGLKLGKRKKKKLLHLSPCWFNFYAEHILENAGLEETQAEIKRKNKNINNFRYADDTTDIASSKE